MQEENMQMFISADEHIKFYVPENRLEFSVPVPLSAVDQKILSFQFENMYYLLSKKTQSSVDIVHNFALNWLCTDEIQELVELLKKEL